VRDHGFCEDTTVCISDCGLSRRQVRFSAVRLWQRGPEYPGRSWLGLRKSVDDEEFSIPGEEKHSGSIRILQRSESPELSDAEQPVQLYAGRFDHGCSAIGTRWIASIPSESEVRFLNCGDARNGECLINGG